MLKSIADIVMNQIFTKSWRPFFWILGIGTLLYAHTILFNFTYLDDNQLILNNYHFISKLANLPRLFQEDVFHQTFGGSYYRPILALSLMIDTQFGGSNPLVFHLSNVIMHLLASCLLYLFLSRLEIRRELSLFFSLFFTVHPVLTQAVAWIPGRNDTLLTIFVLLSFIFFIDFLKTRKWPFLILHLLTFFIALFTKENALILPLLCLLYLYFILKKRFPWSYLFPHQNLWRVGWVENPAANEGGVWCGNLLTILGAWLMVISPWFYFRQMALKSTIGNSDFDIIHSILFNSPATLSYLGKILFPFNLSVLPILKDLTPVYGLITLSLIAFLLLISKNKRLGFIIFGVCWFLLFLFPSFIQSSTSVANFSEHRLYLPFIGFIIVSLEMDFVKKIDFGKKRIVVLEIIILALLSTLTFRHSYSFSNRLNFWQNAVETSPNYAFNHNNLGAMCFLDGKPDKAEVEWKKALELNPNERLVHGNLGLIYMNSGRAKDAESEFIKEIQINPLYDNVYFNLGLLYSRQGKLKAAERLWQKTLTLNPDYLDAYYNLAVYYYWLKDYGRAAYYRNEILKRGGKLPSELLNIPP